MENEKYNNIKNQIEYYLSDKNLSKDEFFHKLIKNSENGFVDINIFLKCNAIKKNNYTKNDIIEAIKLSNELELDETLTKIKRKNNILPELELLLRKKKKKEKIEEKKEEKKEIIQKKNNNNIKPSLYSINSDKPNKFHIKDLIKEFKYENPSIEILYSRFVNNKDYICFDDSNLTEKINPNFDLNDINFIVTKIEDEDEIKKFWDSSLILYNNHLKFNERKQNKNNNKTIKFLKHKVKLGNEMYDKIKDIKNKIKMIRNEYKNNEKILGNDGDILYDLLRFHHNFKEKIKDFEYFTIGNSKGYKYLKCFYIVKTNGEKIDFSINKCLDNLIQKYNQNKLSMPDFYDNLNNNQLI